jgi:ATP-dependent DNA helicase RecG
MHYKINLKMFSNEYIGHLINRGNDEQNQIFETKNKLPSDFYITICAFLNSQGGEIIIVESAENGIIGLTDTNLNMLHEKIKVGLVTQSNLNPKIRLTIKSLIYYEEKILYIKVPIGQGVFSCKGGKSIYERIGASNCILTNLSDQLRIQENKRVYYPDIKIIKYLNETHFNLDIYKKALNLISQTKASHPWLKMDFEQVMKSSGLWRVDLYTRESGYTIAAALLFGKDEVISTIFPSFRIDALREKEGYEGYYDRDTFTTNIIDSYFRLMSFVGKHLPDIFIMKDSARIGLRDQIYREVFINFLIHQDYAAGLPSKFAITQSDGTFTANGNKIVFNKNIDPNDYHPFPKNPLIGKFLREMGLAEELGFGLKKITSLVSIFSDDKPQFHDGKVFFTSIPPPTKKISKQVANPQVISNFQLNFDSQIKNDKDPFKKAIDEINQITNISQPYNEENTQKEIAETTDDEFTINVKSKNENRTNDEIKFEEIYKNLFDYANDSKKTRLINILLLLRETQFSTTQNLIIQLNVSRETIARDVKTLKENKIIDFKGALKNGRYYLSEKGHLFAKLL